MFFSLSVSSHAVLVAWDANPPSEGVEGYKIYLASGGVTNAPIVVGNVLLAPLPNLLPGIQYQLYITAYNAAGESDPSDSLFYTPPAGSVLPSITAQPANRSVPQGGTIELTVTAAGTAPLRYDWMRNGSPIPNSNTNRLVIPNGQAANAGTYTVRVSNPLGTITSQSAIVSIVIGPVITLQPESKSILQGSRFSFSVNATGSAPLSYQWQKGNANISGGTSSSLVINSAQLSDFGSYRVRVTNAAGAVFSTSVTLEVLPLANAVRPGFNRLLRDTNVLVGETIVLDPQVVGTEPMSIQWHSFNGPLPGQNGRTLTLGPLNIEDSSGYYAIAANSLGAATSAVAIVTISNPPEILPPTIVTQPGSLLVNKGTFVTFEVEAVSNGPIFYQWMKNGTNMVNETNAVLQLNNITANDEGDYSVLVFNDAGSELSDVAPLRVHALPLIGTEAVNVEVAEGGSTTLVGATNSTEQTRFQWFKNGAPVSGATNGSFIVQNASAADEATYQVAIIEATTLISAPARVFVISPPSIVASPSDVLVAQGLPAEFGVAFEGRSTALQWFKDGVPIPGARDAFLVIPEAQYSDMAAYSVRASNIAGEAFSTGALLEIAGPPQLTAQPQGGTFNERSNFSLSVSAIGAAPVTYQWHYNGAPLPAATNSILAFTNASPSFQGNYHVAVSNAFGRVNSALAEVQILLLPRITAQPESLRAVRGDSAVLSVAAEGPGSLEYQWQRNGAPLAGQTEPSILLDSVQESDTGSYYVTVRNAAGQITSLPASLVVLSPVSIETPPANREIPEGQALSLTVAASGTAPMAFQWFKNETPIADATNDVLTIPNVTTNDAANYTVRVSNELNQVTSDPATVTVATAPRIFGLGGEVSVHAGRSSFVLSPVHVSGSGPFAFQWFKNDEILPGATASNLLFAVIQTDAAGAYQLRVSNLVSTVFSDPVVLKVRTAPVIVVQPVGGEFPEGASKSLSVTAAGDGPFTYQWFLNGEPIPGATAEAYEIGSLSDTNAGTYTVRVENDVSAVSSAEARIVVIVARARIASQSQSHSVAEGGSTVLSVQASGALPIAYQWHKGGVAIPGATAPNLVFYGIRIDEAGPYTVAVENSLGREVSQSIDLSVSPPQQGGQAPPPRNGTWSVRPVFTLQSESGETFEIQGRRQLGDGAWETLGAAKAAENGLLHLSLGSEPQGAAAFFRLKK